MEKDTEIATLVSAELHYFSSRIAVTKVDLVAFSKLKHLQECKRLCLKEIELHPSEITEEMTMAIQDTIFEMTQKMTVRRRTTGITITIYLLFIFLSKNLIQKF